jgi:hypothetical protein
MGACGEACCIGSSRAFTQLGTKRSRSKRDGWRPCLLAGRMQSSATVQRQRSGAFVRCRAPDHLRSRRRLLGRRGRACAARVRIPAVARPALAAGPARSLSRSARLRDDPGVPQAPCGASRRQGPQLARAGVPAVLAAQRPAAAAAQCLASSGRKVPSGRLPGRAESSSNSTGSQGMAPGLPSVRTAPGTGDCGWPVTA